MSADPQPSDPKEWLERHGDYLYRNALLRLRDPDAAEEVVQETFLAALTARGSFRGESSERTWMVGILKNKVIDHLRRRLREIPGGTAEELPCEREGLFDARGHWRAGMGPSTWSDPTAALEQREFWRVLQRCLDGLPPRLRSAFVLREVDDLSTDAICGALSVTATNLGVMLHRCRMQLRRCLEGQWQPTPRARP